MLLADYFSVVQWWGLLFVIGFISLPIIFSIFPNFFDKGYIFAKTLGIVTISYIIFLISILHLLPFTRTGSLIILALFVGIFILYSFLNKNFLNILKKKWMIFLFEEILFLAALLFWSAIKSYQPDIHGLEKYMDFGFINSILRSDYFPPKDMWFTPFYINYYYFGHLITAVLTKISGMSPSITYNLMLSTILALIFTGVFSIGANLIRLVSKSGIQNSKQKKHFGYSIFDIRILFGGLLTAFLATFAGNLHTIYAFFKPYLNENPVPFWQLLFSPNTFPNSYWYPNATRFIHNTIHEFPIYSFVVSDLHGHVLDIPIVLLIISILLHEFVQGKINLFKYILISFLLAVAYMTNAWDAAVYLLLCLFVLTVIWLKIKPNISSVAYPVLIIFAGFLFFSFPFSYNFKPFVSGIGILCSPDFLTSIGKIGPFIFEPSHCQRSPFWQLLILYGFFYFWVISFLVLIFKLSSQISPTRKRVKLFKNLDFNILDFIENFKLKIKNLSLSDQFVLLLIFLSTLLIIIPEFIYIKDIYPAHYRANTMFKLTYQAFIMLSISSGYIIIRMISSTRYPIGNLKFGIGNYWKFITIVIGSIGFFLVAVYPYFAVNSYFGNLQSSHGLNGISYLKNLYPTDYEAILWINKNISGQPVILEAQGDSYTDFARVSANTGLPTVLGWTVHEWLWRGTYDIPAPRIPEVQQLYETRDINLTKQLINKYKVSLVFVGDLERQKYKSLNEEKFIKIGRIIYSNGNTQIYQLDTRELQE